MSRLADVTVVDDGTHRWHLYTSTEEEKKMREHEDHKQKEANSPAGTSAEQEAVLCSFHFQAPDSGVSWELPRSPTKRHVKTQEAVPINF